MTRKVSLALLIAVVVVGLFWGDAGEPDALHGIEAPSRQHWLGTDALGRGLGSRLLQAAALSLAGSVLAWGVALILGVGLGAFAGFTRGSLGAHAVEEMTRVAYATPFLVVLVGLAPLLGPGRTSIYLILLLFAWAQPARQAALLAWGLRNATHVRAALALGYRPTQMVRFVLFPEVLPPTTTAALAVLPEILALDVALSFFGLGAQPPFPSLGGLLVDGLAYASVAPWLLVAPLLAVSAICVALRGLRGGLAETGG